MAAAATSRIDGRPVRDQRHEPPPGGARPDGLDPPDRQRRPARSSVSGSAAHPEEHAASASTSRDAAGAGRPARGGGRRPPRAVDAADPVTRPSPYYPLDDAHARPDPDAAAADHHRRRDAGRRPAGRADRRRLDHLRRQLRGEPAAATSSRSRRPGGDARTSPSSSGSRATGSATPPSPRRPGCRTRARPGSAGTRPAPTARSSSRRTTADVDALVEAVGRW